jgi:hypothetical protein
VRDGTVEPPLDGCLPGHEGDFAGCPTTPSRGLEFHRDVRYLPAMCCLALSAGFIGPRFALLLWWIFGTKVDAAFSSFFWPLLGLLFLPWTTIAYVLAWGPLHGVSGAGWIVVALGVALDVATYASKPAQARYAG